MNLSNLICEDYSIEQIENYLEEHGMGLRHVFKAGLNLVQTQEQYIALFWGSDICKLIIYCDEDNSASVQERYNDVDVCEKFMKVILRFSSLLEKDIPFEEWSDLAQEVIDLITKNIENNDWDYENDPNYQPLSDKYSARYDKLLKDPRYNFKLNGGYL